MIRLICTYIMSRTILCIELMIHVSFVKHILNIVTFIPFNAFSKCSNGRLDNVISYFIIHSVHLHFTFVFMVELWGIGSPPV